MTSVTSCNICGLLWCFVWVLCFCVCLHAARCQMVVCTRCGTWLRFDCRFRPVCLKTNFSRALSSDLLPSSCLCFLVSHPALHTSAASNSPHAHPLISAPRYQLPGATAPAPPPLRLQTGTLPGARNSPTISSSNQ